MSARQSEEPARGRKPTEYHEGKDAASRFAAAMKAIIPVPKQRIVELELHLLQQGEQYAREDI
jgi:hypothetical protein